MKIEVKDCHIKAGIKGNCFDCPVALALKEQIEDVESVNVRAEIIKWHVHGKYFWQLTNDETAYFVERFDNDLEVHPFTFDLKV